MADSTTDYNNLDPLGDEAAVVDEVDAAVSGARKKPRAVDMVPEEPDAMAPDEEYQLTPAGRRERIGQIVRLVKKYRVWDNLTPVRLRRLLEELGPMFVKMGQILANRSEIRRNAFATSCVVCAPTWSRCRTRSYSVVWKKNTACAWGRCSMRSTPIRLVAHRSRRCTALVW